MGPSEGLCYKKISRTQTFLKIMGCEKSMKLHQKSMKYWWIDQIVYSHFLIKKWKVKMFGTITARINIEKLNERGKKKAKCKVRVPLDKTSYTLAWGFCFYIYKYWFKSWNIVFVFATLQLSHIIGHVIFFSFSFS